MEFRLKLVTGVAAASLVAGLAACGPGGDAGQTADQAALLGEDAGGGEGGEGEGGAAVGLTPDQMHLLHIVLMQGHLAAGAELVARGEVEMGAGHAGHPRAEIYENNEAEFAARGQTGIADALDAYLARLQESPPQVVLDAARAAVDEQLSAAAAQGSLSDHAEALSELMSEMAAEYALGVQDGVIVQPHEFQDAWGFLRAGAAQFEARRADYEAADPEAAAAVAARFAEALAAFPDILAETPPPIATIRAVTTQVALALYPFR